MKSLAGGPSRRSDCVVAMCSRSSRSTTLICTNRYKRSARRHRSGKVLRAVPQRWKQRPPGSTWGDWGDDDELGRINLLTPEKVLQGVREVEAGIVFSLSLPLDFPGGSALEQRRRPPVLAPTQDLKGNPANFFNVHM